MGRGAVVDVVEACYSLQQDEQAWLDHLLEAAKPGLDQGLGVFAFTYRLLPGGQVEGGVRRSIDAQLDLDSVIDYLGWSTRDVNQKGFPPVPWFGPGTKLTGALEADDELKRLVVDVGVRENWGLVAPCAPDRGLVVAAGRPAIGSPPRRMTYAWLRVAIHVSTALRLRRTLEAAGSLGDPLAGADAVLDPDGRVQHASGGACPRAARDVLREAVRRIDRARGVDREDGVDLWQGLVDGRWTLLDHFDSDGRRFLVARRNDPRFGRPLKLTQRERQVLALAAAGQANKLIGYTLGITGSSVASALADAMAKLGLHARTDLASFSSLLAEQRDPPPRRD